MISVEDAARDYARFFEELTPESLARLGDICAPNVRFRDPFNDVTGLAAYRRVFEKMFEDTSDPSFEVRDFAVSGQIAYIRWDFRFRPTKGDDIWRIEGMSEVVFDDKGLVEQHIDHWDSGRQFYEKLPILGALIRMVKRRLAA